MNRPQIVNLALEDLTNDQRCIKKYICELESRIDRIIKQDAAVIDKAAKEIIERFGYADGGSWVIDASDIKDYVNQLHQKQQESE